jgi:hypothetical protein
LVRARFKPLFEEQARQRQAALQRRKEPPVPPNLEERGELFLADSAENPDYSDKAAGRLQTDLCNIEE